MKRKEIVYYNDIDINYNDLYEEYKEHCELNDTAPAGENSNEFYNWMYDEFSDRWDCFKANLECSPINDNKCVVLGSLGLWTGRHDIEPQKFDSLLDAIGACVSGCDYIKVSQYCSEIWVTGLHHDGRNSFIIKILNDRGRETENGDLNNRRYHLTLHDYLY